jgi:acetyl-CoA carboxylase beta subunit
MQMAKTSAVLARLHEESVPFISAHRPQCMVVCQLTWPMLGGVVPSRALIGLPDHA